MKKLILLIAVLLLTFTLSACKETGFETCEENGGTIVHNDLTTTKECFNGAYTKAEVDVLLELQEEKFDDILTNMDLSLGYGADGSISICIDFNENNVVMGDCIKMENSYLKDVLGYYTQDDFDYFYDGEYLDDYWYFDEGMNEMYEILEFISLYIDFLDEFHDMNMAIEFYNNENVLLEDNENDLADRFRESLILEYPEWFEEGDFDYEPEFITVSDDHYTITVEYYEGTFIAIINEITVCNAGTCEIIEDWVQTDYVITREELYIMFESYLEQLETFSNFK